MGKVNAGLQIGQFINLESAWGKSEFQREVFAGKPDGVKRGINGILVGRTGRCGD